MGSNKRSGGKMSSEMYCNKCKDSLPLNSPCYCEKCLKSEIERAKKEGMDRLLLKICEENKLHNRGNMIGIKMISSYIAEMEKEEK
jgi:hypothetical protein